MSTGIEMLSKIKEATSEKPPGFVYWLDRVDQYDLCKLKVSDLVSLGYDADAAGLIVRGLNKVDFSKLGESLGIEIRVKFRAWADRHHDGCKIRGEGLENVRWLQEYIKKKIPPLALTAIAPIEATPLYWFDVVFSGQVNPADVQKSLHECEAIYLMRDLALRIAERSHYSVQPYNLAAWIEDQTDYWWTVDGDPVLMGRLEFPCPSDEIAKEIRNYSEPLLVLDPSGTGHGEEITSDEIEQCIVPDKGGYGQLMISWDSLGFGWELVRDNPIAV